MKLWFVSFSFKIGVICRDSRAALKLDIFVLEKDLLYLKSFFRGGVFELRDNNSGRWSNISYVRIADLRLGEEIALVQT